MNYPRPDSGLCKAVDSASLSNPAYETVWLNYWLAADLSCRAANVHQLVFRLDSSACMPTLTWEWGKTSPGQRFHPPSYEVVEAYQASPYHHDAGMPADVRSSQTSSQFLGGPHQKNVQRRSSGSKTSGVVETVKTYSWTLRYRAAAKEDTCRRFGGSKQTR